MDILDVFPLLTVIKLHCSTIVPATAVFLDIIKGRKDLIIPTVPINWGCY